MVTSALFGVLYFAWKVAGLPFAPFDTFDWLARVLPGRVIAFGIGTTVTVIRALNLGPIYATAKMTEQAMAIIGLFVAAVVGAVILFVILRTVRGRYGVTLGLALGIVVGFPVMLVSVHASDTASVGTVARAVWILTAFVVWA
jgi:hypothetical protein